MMLNTKYQSIKNRFYNKYYKNKGWKTDRKIIVVESDDWGSIRMPSLEVFNKLISKGIRVDKLSYNRYDSLATIEDFDALFKILKKYKDKNGNHPVITANTIVANPDFHKIKEDGFSNYHYELFTETIKRDKQCSFESWKYGMDEKLFCPQLHGREHLNVNKWMNYLQNKNSVMLECFENNFFGISPDINNKSARVLEAFQLNEYTSKQDIDKIIKEAAIIFEEIFGFSSKSIIAPNYTWNQANETMMLEVGIKYIQGTIIQRDLIHGNKYNYTGKQNTLGQTFLVRNVAFEPSSLKQTLSDIIKDIERCFYHNVPVIISSHRINFIGSIVKENRIQNLILLDELLKEIVRKWKDIEFLTSDQLGNVITS